MYDFTFLGINWVLRDPVCCNENILVPLGFHSFFCRFASFGQSFATWPSSLHDRHWVISRVFWGLCLEFWSLVSCFAKMF